MKPFWDIKTLKSLHREYLAGAYASTLAKRRKRTSAELLDAFRKSGLRILERKPITMPKRVPAEKVAAMHALYQTGATFADVGRKFGCHGSTVRDLFLSRGLPVRDIPNKWRHHRPDGTWESLPPKTPEEIEALIQAATRIQIPAELQIEWRKWPMERRGDFIRRVRARLNDPLDRPNKPFSANVIPFDYATPAAWNIIRSANKGLNSREFAMHIKLVSQGVIWNGKLWFWARKTGTYIEGAAWIPGKGRKVLSRAIWESIHGPLPPLAVVRFADGNPNNLDPSNLRLSDKNEVCRESQSAAIARKSRAQVASLLSLHLQPTQNHALALKLSKP